MYSAEQIKPVAPSSQKWYLTASLLWAVLCLVQERGNRSKMAEEEKAETVCPRVSLRLRHVSGQGCLLTGNMCFRRPLEIQKQLW